MIGSQLAPDGTTIAFRSAADGGRGLYAKNLSGGDEHCARRERPRTRYGAGWAGPPEAAPPDTDLLRTLEYVVVDVETTGGASWSGHRIIDTAGIRRRGKVASGDVISPGCTAVAGWFSARRFWGARASRCLPRFEQADPTRGCEDQSFFEQELW